MGAPTGVASSPHRPLDAHLIRQELHALALEEVSTDGAKQLIADTRFASLLATEASHRAITRVFGIPREAQSPVVMIVLCGSVAAVLWDALAKLVPHPKSADLEICGSLINTAARGLAGLPIETMPLAGLVIVLALAARAGHDALHDLRVAMRELAAALRHRYGHLISVQPARP